MTKTLMQTATEKKDANVCTRVSALVSYIFDRGKKEFGLIIFFFVFRGVGMGATRAHSQGQKNEAHAATIFFVLSLYNTLLFTAKIRSDFFSTTGARGRGCSRRRRIG